MTPHARSLLVVLLACLAVVLIAACAPAECRPWGDAVPAREPLTADPRWVGFAQLWVGVRCRY